MLKLPTTSFVLGLSIGNCTFSSHSFKCCILATWDQSRGLVVLSLFVSRVHDLQTLVVLLDLLWRRPPLFVFSVVVFPTKPHNFLSIPHFEIVLVHASGRGGETTPPHTCPCRIGKQPLRLEVRGLSTRKMEGTCKSRPLNYTTRGIMQIMLGPLFST